MQRFFIPQTLTVTSIIPLPEDIAHQCRLVLRYKGQERVILVDPTHQAAYAIIEMTSTQVLAKVSELLPALPEQIEITLIQGLIRKERWEYFLQKATEVGVTRIVPLKLERNVVKWSDDEIKHKLDRYRKILTEAAEQSHRTTVPILEHPIGIDELFKYASQLNFVAYEAEKSQALKASLSPAASVTVVLGSEGGISPSEHRKMVEQGFVSVHLGPRILRAETAGIVATTILQTLLET